MDTVEIRLIFWLSMFWIKAITTVSESLQTTSLNFLKAFSERF